jgi:flavin reductase (DIM6/NTAB) family NADH-FMN oxidoreductase RutF
MRQLLGGVALIATGTGVRRRGLIATSVSSLSTTPPTLIVSIAKSAEAHPVILEMGAFSVNLLADHHKLLSVRFSGQDGTKSLERFAVGNWSHKVTGVPVLADSLASFDCVVSHTFDVLTHTIVAGRVLDVSTDDSKVPLGYFRGDYVANSPTQAQTR